MRTRTVVLGLVLLTGCAAPTAGAKLQEASQELNINARFGRMEMAVERVAQKNREQWLRNHRGWGGKIRVVDVETAGTRMATTKDKEAEAEVTVRVSWFRMEEQDLRQTTLRQKWKDINGDWQLVDEAKVEGDPGLLGEPPDPSEARAPAAGASGEPAKPKPRFPTIRIGSPDDEPPYSP